MDKQDICRPVVVYSDNRYVLAKQGDISFLKINNKTYKLSCHPYEPCLYITDEDGVLTSVHNAFDPDVVLDIFAKGGTVASITGLKYNAEDFCRMVEYAKDMGNIQIDDAERVFRNNIEEKFADNACKPADKAHENTGEFSAPGGVSVIENDPFYNISEEYPDDVIDYCLIKNEASYNGIDSHWAALLQAALRIITEDWVLRFDTVKISAKSITAEEMFALPDKTKNKLNFRKAFLYPPYPNGYTDADFERLNEALFPNGRKQLKIFEWSTDWSDYFDDGHEWWGTLCLTVYDKTLDRFAVIMASATD